MRKIEPLLGFIIVAAVILKLNLIPGGSVLCVFAFSILGFIYSILGFAIFNEIRFRHVFKKESYKGLTPLKIIGTIGFGWALSSTCMGILFKVLLWSGADTILISGLIQTLIVLIVALIQFAKNKAPFYKRVFKRIAIIGGFGLILSFVSDLTIVKMEYRNHPRYIEAFKEAQNNPEDETLKEKEYIEYMRVTLTKEEFELFIKGTQSKFKNQTQ